MVDENEENPCHTLDSESAERFMAGRALLMGGIRSLVAPGTPGLQQFFQAGVCLVSKEESEIKNPQKWFRSLLETGTRSKEQGGPEAARPMQTSQYIHPAHPPHSP